MFILGDYMFMYMYANGKNGKYEFYYHKLDSISCIKKSFYYIGKIKLEDEE